MECDVCCGSRSSLAPRPSRSAAKRRCASSFGVPLLPNVEGASGAVGRLRRSVVRRRSESTIAAPQTLDRISVTTSVMCAGATAQNAPKWLWTAGANDGTHRTLTVSLYLHVPRLTPPSALLASRRLEQRRLRMLPVSALSTAFAGPPPARMHATLPGVKDPSPYTIYSGYLDAGVPPSGRGKMSGPTPALAPTLALALAHQQR